MPWIAVTKAANRDVIVVSSVAGACLFSRIHEAHRLAANTVKSWLCCHSINAVTTVASVTEQNDFSEK